MIKEFVQVDAFSHRPLFGNPAAVVFEAEEIPPATMQKIAREMNLSETVFLQAPTGPEADYRARIFTPCSELPFAGHPTIAAAHAFLQRYPGSAPPELLRQECGIGIVPVEILTTPSGQLLRMTQAPPKFRDAPLSRDMLARMLGCAESDFAGTPISVVSTGVPWLVVELSGLAAISRLIPDQALIARWCKSVGSVGLTAFAEKEDGSPVRLRLRTFAPGEGVPEDPVCGSGNGSVAAFLACYKHPNEPQGSYLAEQGIEIARDGEVHVWWNRDGGELRVLVGGRAVTVISGELHL
jgi:PhzF family phenazine biosynthesis protein